MSIYSCGRCRGRINWKCRTCTLTAGAHSHPVAQAPTDVAFREEVVALRRDLVTAVQEIRDLVIAMRPAVVVDNVQPAPPRGVAFREEVVALRGDLVTAVVQEIRDAMRPAVAVDNFQPASPRAQMLRLEYNKNCGCRRRRKFRGTYLGRLLCRHSSPSFHVLEWGGM
eukprot:CAMPEP_0170112374 /NCGR_PEP_ID=MMETSP0020_2-20130122/9106_1 /TAXON_ID=98059 /ORGANISM="Dinobryon sp., Strain UTEXLB2267" /LENGTH=167 /DNA_ID=CAMNT_0010338229 /DNA_START=1 /DNA_END=504 /DNA_ORIENTATION=+